MKILMLGWEYPPRVSGGLGIASQGLARALVAAGHEVTFVLPKSSITDDGAIHIINAAAIQTKRKKWNKAKKKKRSIITKELGARLIPYVRREEFWSDSSIPVEKEISYESAVELLEKIELTGNYGKQLLDEILKFSFLVSEFVFDTEFDIVHCHDWMTFKAGQTVQEELNIPLVLHFHSTELERNGLYPIKEIENLERMASAQADSIFAVSKRTSQIIANSYHIPEKKIRVLPNGYTNNISKRKVTLKKKKKIGFIGRLTQQKNPKKFLDFARLLSSSRSDVSFLIIGDGDLMEDIRKQLAMLNLEVRTELTGFLSHEQTLLSLIEMDLLLVPSLHEPFGLVPLEAIRSKVPVICSEGAGIKEFIPSLMTIPGWNDHQWIKAINEILDDQAYTSAYVERCLDESQQLSWEKVSSSAIEYYATLIKRKND
ncbi:MAG: glycosyltransferase family 4 protein [Cyclobacteriaceae bacterium]